MRFKRNRFFKTIVTAYYHTTPGARYVQPTCTFGEQ